MNAQIEPHELSPLRGTMAGVKLAFPRFESDGVEYCAASILYANEKTLWSDNPHLKVKHLIPTQDTVISSFSIVLNRATFKPIASKSDLYSFAGSFRIYGDEDLPPAYMRWAQFAFSPQLYSKYNGSLKSLYEEQRASSTRFIHQFSNRSDRFGLHVISSDQEGGPFMKRVVGDVYDTWYFDEQWNTLISCMRDSQSKDPAKIDCVHYFVVPELRAVAYARTFTITDVTDWNQLQDVFRARALSYIVEREMERLEHCSGDITTRSSVIFIFREGDGFSSSEYAA